jgi:endonuclease/exonuclease/phosphatase family metal-dependent hydrolase
LQGEGPTQIRIATWNIKWLNAEDNKGVVKRQTVDYERLQRYARQLDADVIALQEIDGPEAAARIFDPKEYAFHFPKKRQVQSVGFAIRRSLPFQARPDLSALAQRHLRPGADLSVKVAGQELRLLSVHLKAGCVKGPLDRSGKHCTKLRKQLPVLEAWIDARAREETAFVVLGDFNRRFHGDDPFWAAIDDADPPNADLSAPTRQRNSQCWKGRSPRFIDHIVLDRVSRAWLQPDSFVQTAYSAEDHPHEKTLSDHCPITVVLKPPAP